VKCIYCQSEAAEDSQFCSKTCSVTWSDQDRLRLLECGINLKEYPELTPDPCKELEWLEDQASMYIVEHPDGCTELLEDKNAKPGNEEEWTKWCKHVALELYSPGGDIKAAEKEIRRVLDLVPPEHRESRKTSIKGTLKKYKDRIQQGEELGPPALSEAMLDLILVAWHNDQLSSLPEDAANVLKLFRKMIQQIHPRDSDAQRDKEVQKILLDLKCAR